MIDKGPENASRGSQTPGYNSGQFVVTLGLMAAQIAAADATDILQMRSTSLALVYCERPEPSLSSTIVHGRDVSAYYNLS